MYIYVKTLGIQLTVSAILKRHEEFSQIKIKCLKHEVKTNYLNFKHKNKSYMSDNSYNEFKAKVLFLVF